MRKRTIGALKNVLLGAILIAGTARADEAGAEAYVILSLVGDHLTVVRQRGQTGSHIDVNEYEVMPMASTGLDDFAVRTADAIVAKIRPNAGSVTIRADPSTLKITESWLDADVSGVAEALFDIKKHLPPLPDAHLLVIAPFRDEPHLLTGSDARGSGKVGGLGFYYDYNTHFQDVSASRGYLGVFANYQLILINLQTNVVEAHERVALGTTHPAAYAPDRQVWNALSAAQKTRALESLLKKGIGESLPKMLAPSKP
jgi:hypothetical protein